MLGLLLSLPALARDFTYEYEGQTLTYTVLDEDAKTCYTKPGRMENNIYFPGNNVSGDVKIPSVAEVDDIEYKVTAIGGGSFMNCPQLKSVEIPNTVTIIDNLAFALSSDLTDVVLPNSITIIGNSVFYGCSSLSSIDIPDSVTTLGEQSFLGCTALSSVSIGNSLQAIADAMFYECKSLASVTIGNSVVSIGESAFSGCALTSIEIPNSVVSIGHQVFRECEKLETVSIGQSCASIPFNVFWDCSALQSISVDENNQTYASIDGVLYNKNLTELIRCPQAKTSVEIPSTITKVNYDAFRDCKNLPAIELSNSVESIGGFAFKGCSNLRSFRIPDKITEIEDNTFYGCTSLTSIDIHDNITSVSVNAFCDCISLETVNIGKSVANIESEAFEGCSSVKTFNVSDENSVYLSKDGVLYNKDLTKLVRYPGVSTSFEIPASVTTIGRYACNSCVNLDTVVIPETVTIIEEFAFSFCEMNSLWIPKSITSFGNYAFEWCMAKEVYYNTTEPISSENQLFNYDAFNNTTLYVPIGAVPAFQSVFPWNRFNNTEEKYFGVVADPVVKAGDAVLNSENGYKSEDAVTISLSCETEGAEIYYRLSDKDEYSLYKEPFTVDASSTLSVYAEYYHTQSGTKNYAIEIEYPEAPELEVSAGGSLPLDPETPFESEEAVELTLTCDIEEADIYYRLTPISEAEPTAEPGYTLYTGPIKVETTSTLSVYIEHNGVKSDIKTYTIDIKTNLIALTFADLEEVEFYTLEGLKVAHPVAGKIYLIRKNGHTFKAILK